MKLLILRSFLVHLRSKCHHERPVLTPTTVPCPLSVWLIIFVWVTNIYQPTNAHIISHKTHLKHSDMFRSCQIIIRELSSLLKLYYSQFNWYLQTRCCGSISCCVGMCCGAVTSHCSDMFRSCQIIIRERSSLLKLYYSIHSSIGIYKRDVVFANTNWIVNTII